MNAMHFAWTILKEFPDRRPQRKDRVEEMMQFVLANAEHPDPVQRQKAQEVYEALMSAGGLAGMTANAPLPPEFSSLDLSSASPESMGEMDGMSPSEMDDEDFPAAPEYSSTDQGYSRTKPSIPYPFDTKRASMEFLRKYDPSIYGRAGRASPYVADGRSRPVSPEKRIARQGQAMEQQDAAERDRNRLMQEMQAAGMTQEAMGVLPFQDLMRQSKTPQGAAMIRQMIRNRQPMAEVPDSARDRIQLSEPMSAIDAAWAVLKSM
jgi:hypothetical protein